MLTRPGSKPGPGLDAQHQRSKDHIYESPTHIAGLPLYSNGPAAQGITAGGGRAAGVIALGGIAAGLIAFGGLALGVISIGGFSIGLLSIVGNGVAYGALESSGRQKEHLLE